MLSLWGVGGLALSQQHRHISHRPTDCAHLVGLRSTLDTSFLPSIIPSVRPSDRPTDRPTGCCVVRVRLSFVVAPLHLLFFLSFVVLVMLMLPFPSSLSLSLSPLAFHWARSLSISQQIPEIGAGERRRRLDPLHGDAAHHAWGPGEWCVVES